MEVRDNTPVEELDDETVEDLFTVQSMPGTSKASSKVKGGYKTSKKRRGGRKSKVRTPAVDAIRLHHAKQS